MRRRHKGEGKPKGGRGKPGPMAVVPPGAQGGQRGRGQGWVLRHCCLWHTWVFRGRPTKCFQAGNHPHHGCAGPARPGAANNGLVVAPRASPLGVPTVPPHNPQGGVAATCGAMPRGTVVGSASTCLVFQAAMGWPPSGGGAPASLPHMAPGARDAFGQGHRAAPAGPVQQFGDCMRAARLPQGAAQRRCPNTPLLGHSCTPPQCVACSHPRAQLASAAGPRAKLKPRAMVKTHVSHHHYDVVRFILEVHLSIRFD